MSRYLIISTAKSWLATLMLLASPALAGELYTSNGFEQTHFTPGTLDAQDVWSIPSAPDIDPTGAVIQTAHAQEGTQALQLRNTGQRATARLSMTIEQECWLDFMFYMPKADEIVGNPTFIFRGRTSSGEAADFLKTQFTVDGRVPDLQTPSPHKVVMEDWNRLTFRLNPAEGVWDLYINGELTISGEPSENEVTFSRITIIDFNWTGREEFPEDGVFIDNVTISTEKPDFEK